MPSYLSVDQSNIAFVHQNGAHSESPGLVFLPGFRSSMNGDKATHLRALAAGHGWSFTSLDYSGHGASGGEFEAGHVGLWSEQARAVLDTVITGPVYLVGSSMGAWVATRVALANTDRVKAVVTVAAAADFTEDLLPANLSPAQQTALSRGETVFLPSQYGDGPYPISPSLLAGSRQTLVLRNALPLDCPLRAIHGEHDTDVPVEQSIKLLARWRGADKQLIRVTDGDHRLSRPQDLALLADVVTAVIAEGEPNPSQPR